MRKPKTFLSSTLTEEELKQLQDALQNGHIPTDILEKLILARKKSTGNREDLLKDPNYPFRRAFVDGRGKELEWIHKLITEGEPNE